MNKSQNPTDRFLILQYRAGDASVLPTLVRRYHKIFCEKAYWITKDKESAKDIAQESWITIIDKLETLKNIDRFRSWAFRIVYTKAIDAVKQRIKKNKDLQSVRILSIDTSSSEVERNLAQKKLLKAIQELPKEKQDIIRLFYAEEYSIVDISSFLKIPIGTVKSRLFKAREKLKSTIKNLNHEK